VDKWAETGLTPIPSLKVKPPRIGECFSHMECRVVQTHTCGDHTLFVGEVLATTVDEGVMKGESLDVLKARPIVQKNHVYFTVSEK
jgi:flavin reductase (DIM6/NTAB) family NADH-FMN oxidoreductase RutF